MRRRLDLGAALVAKPPVLFLDEPTTGLDPRNRLGMWEVIERLVAEGTTVLLTTQYLDEADRLADTIAVIDHGRLIAQGTSDQLKDQVGGERLEVRLDAAADRDLALCCVRWRDQHGRARIRRFRASSSRNIAFGGFVTGLGLNEDVHKGLIDRFRSLPMAPPAVLAGRTLADVVTNALSIGVLLMPGVISVFRFTPASGARSREWVCCCCPVTRSAGCSP